MGKFRSTFLLISFDTVQRCLTAQSTIVNINRIRTTLCVLLSTTIQLFSVQQIKGFIIIIIIIIKTNLKTTVFNNEL